MAECESWRAISGWEGFYEVSDLGRVRSVDRTIELIVNGRARTRRIRGRLMAPVSHSHGYVQVGLRRPGEHETRLVHALVLETFVGPPPPKMEGCHEDNDKTNNRLSNLRWDTHQANCDDRNRHGVQVRGETCGHAVLTEFDVRRIRQLAAHGEPNTEIAAHFGVTPSNIGRIVNRHTWKHVQ